MGPGAPRSKAGGWTASHRTQAPSLAWGPPLVRAPLCRALYHLHLALLGPRGGCLVHSFLHPLHGIGCLTVPGPTDFPLNLPPPGHLSHGPPHGWSRSPSHVSASPWSQPWSFPSGRPSVCLSGNTWSSRTLQRNLWAPLWDSGRVAPELERDPPGENNGKEARPSRGLDTPAGPGREQSCVLRPWLCVCLHRGAQNAGAQAEVQPPGVRSALCGPIPTRAAGGHTLQGQRRVDQAEQQRAAPAAIADLPPSFPAPAPTLVGLYHGPCRRALLGPRALLPPRCTATSHQRLPAPQRPHEGHHQARPGAPTSGQVGGDPPFRPYVQPPFGKPGPALHTPARMGPARRRSPAGTGLPPAALHARRLRAPPAPPRDASRPRHAHRMSDAKPSDQ